MACTFTTDVSAVQVGEPGGGYPACLSTEPEFVLKLGIIFNHLRQGLNPLPEGHGGYPRPRFDFKKPENFLQLGILISDKILILYLVQRVLPEDMIILHLLVQRIENIFHTGVRVYGNGYIIRLNIIQACCFPQL